MPKHGSKRFILSNDIALIDNKRLQMRFKAIIIDIFTLVV